MGELLKKLPWRVIVLGLLVLSAVVIVILIVFWLWASPGRVEASQAQPARENASFDVLASRLMAREKRITKFSQEKDAQVTPDNRAAIIERIVSTSTVFATVPDGFKTVAVTQYPPAQTELRALLDSMIQTGDYTYFLYWTIAGSVVKNLGVTNSSGVPKFEAVLYSSIYRDDAGTANARVEEMPRPFELLARSVVSALAGVYPRLEAQGAQARPSIKVFNFFDVNVVTAEVEIVPRSGAAWPRAVLQLDSVPFWKGEGAPIQSRSYWQGKRKCVSAITDFKWYSYFPLSEVGTTTKLGEAVRLSQGQRVLTKTQCS
jgi:hypothetical protein